MHWQSQTSLRLLAGACLGILMLGMLARTQSPDPHSAENQAAQLDRYVVAPQLTLFNTLGQPTAHLKAQRLEHNTLEKTTVFNQPTLTVQPQDHTQAWHCQAQSGQLDDALTTIQLTQHVQAWQPAGSTHPKRSLTGQQLIYAINQQRLYSHTPIQLKEGNNTLDAAAFVYDLRQAKLHFTGKVRLLYHFDNPKSGFEDNP